MTSAAAFEPAPQPPRLTVVPTDAGLLATLEAEITTLAGHLAAGTAKFLSLLSAFDAAGGWQAHGLRSCAQWLSWKCGMSLTTAREHVRVATALPKLPRLAEAFAAGKVSFSKARAISRVATPATEEGLVETAQACTASQLDRICSGIKHVRSNEEVLTQRASATFRASWREDGMLSFSGRLSPEDGALLLAALAALKAEPVRGNDGAVAGPASPTSGHPDEELPDDRYRDAGMLAARADSEALVMMARHALENPPADVASEPARMIVHTDRPADEAEAPAGAPSGTLDAGPGIPLLPLSPETFERLACEATVEAAGDPDEPAPAVTRKRFAGRRQRRALLRRDGGCCFAGCTRKRGLHAHHVVHFSRGGPTTMANLALLCDHHHLLVHEGGWRLEAATGGSTSGWVAVSPAGERHAAAPPVNGDAGSLTATHLATVGPETITGHWAGEPLDLAYAVGTLVADTGPTEPSVRLAR